MEILTRFTQGRLNALLLAEGITMNNALIKKLQETDIFAPPDDKEIKTRKDAKLLQPISDIEDCFDVLVSNSGPASTIEGELVRAIAKINYRYRNDGDYFYKGYGRETAGSAARFLKSKARELGIDELSAALKLMASRKETEEEEYNGGPYDLGISLAQKAIVDYIISKDKKYTPNTNEEDMLEY